MGRHRDGLKMGDNDRQLATINVKLDTIGQDISEIKNLLYGDGNNDGMRLDVDRLKSSRATHSKVLWVIFTTVLGIGGTVVAGIIMK